MRMGWRGILIWSEVPVEAVITRNPKVMHGEPCFAGTRVTVQTFFDHLEGGYSIDRFLEQFPRVRREQVVALLEQHNDHGLC